MTSESSPGSTRVVFKIVRKPAPELTAARYGASTPWVSGILRCTIVDDVTSLYSPQVLSVTEADTGKDVTSEIIGEWNGAIFSAREAARLVGNDLRRTGNTLPDCAKGLLNDLIASSHAFGLVEEAAAKLRGEEPVEVWVFHLEEYDGGYQVRPAIAAHPVLSSSIGYVDVGRGRIVWGDGNSEAVTNGGNKMLWTRDMEMSPHLAYPTVDVAMVAVSNWLSLRVAEAEREYQAQKAEQESLRRALHSIMDQSAQLPIFSAVQGE